MIAIPNMNGRIAAVLGLGKSGLVAAAALKASGAEVWAWDDAPASRDKAAAAGIATTDLAGCDWRRPDFLCLSPGIPHRFPKPHAIALQAQAAGKPIIGDVELLLRAQPAARYCAITGTNGKSTTTALIGHILSRAGRTVEVGGNIGHAALALAPLGAEGIYVLELSSYQLELTPSLEPEVALLLNLTPDHIDRHGDMAGYAAAKEMIFAGLKPGGSAVIGLDDDYCRAIARKVATAGHRVVGISSRREIAGGVTAAQGRLIDTTGTAPGAAFDLSAIATLPGEHNWQNAAAAYAACRALGLAPDAIYAGLASYPGLAHRQELIATLNGIRYINDSKATNADATAKALACYRPIYWILGGKPKEGGLAGLEIFYDRIAAAYLIGEAAEAFGQALEGQVPNRQCGRLEEAVTAAHRDAQRERRAGAVVLLSPACASFDQFANFEQRGETFRKLVLAATGGKAAA